MKNASFWEQDTFNHSFDLIIIGAGIVGLSSALFFKHRNPDARVIVLDKGSIPEGASTRNAGFLCVGSITEHVADMEKETPENIKKRLQRRYRGMQLLRETLGDQAIDYQNCGGYELFTEQKNFGKATNQLARFNKWMKDITGKKDVYQAERLNGYNVIYNRLEGAIHPGKMMQALIAKTQAAGVHIRWNTNVKKIKKSGVLLSENDSSISGDQVLVASNGFTRRLIKNITIKPGRGLVMVSEPWPGMPWVGIFHYDRGYVYFRNAGDRLLLGGGRNIAMEEETKDQFGINPGIKDYLTNFARQKLTLPEGISFEYEWSGIMGFTPTKTPILQRINDHCVVAAGLSGMGIAIGMDVAQTAVGLLSDISSMNN